MDPKKKKQIALIVLDGWGHREETEFNAIAEAKTPFFNSLWQEYPHTTLSASEEEVGLPIGQIGNSEIGHMTIGAGRVIDTDLVRINKSIKDGTFSRNIAFQKVFNHVNKNESTLHLMGLVSNGGIHSYDAHLHAILKSAKDNGINNVAIHVFTDGRDTPPQSAKNYLEKLEELCMELGLGFIATASGRFYAMDRDNNWNRTERARQAIFEGVGSTYKNKKASSVIGDLYKDGVLDEHIEPVVFLDNLGKAKILQENDGVIFFNFRNDRVRMFSKYIEEASKEKNVFFVTLTQYDEKFGAEVAFAPQKIDATLASVISDAGLSQAHIAETEKYPHATYFLNGGREQPHKGEEHILIESRKDVSTHDQAPEMRAHEIALAGIESVKKGTDFIFINFANADMVGHTANKEAIVVAVETVDKELKKFLEVLHSFGGIAFITSDHGNAEVNIDPITGYKHTAHTLSKVPAIITQKGLFLNNGNLADITPTILSLYGLPIPDIMTGKNLIK